MGELEMILERSVYDGLGDAEKGFYAEKDGKFHLRLKGLDGIKENAEKFAKAQEDMKALEAQLNAFKGLKKTPEEIAAMVKDAAEKGEKLTELEKVQKQLAEMQAEQRARTIRDMKIKALRDAKYSDERIEGLMERVKGEDEATIKADVELLTKIIPTVTSVGGGGNPPAPGLPNPEETSKTILERISRQNDYTKNITAAQAAHFS